MDDIFTTMMPLETTPSVYSTVYAGGTDPLAGFQGQSFFDVLLAQLGMMPMMNGQSEGFTAFSQFPMMPSTGEMTETMVPVEGSFLAEMTETTMPFAELSFEEGMLSQGFPGFLEGSVQTTAAGTSAEGSASVLPGVVVPGVPQPAVPSFLQSMPQTTAAMAGEAMAVNGDADVIEPEIDFLEMTELPGDHSEEKGPSVLQLFKLFSPDNVASMMTKPEAGAVETEMPAISQVQQEPLILAEQKTGGYDTQPVLYSQEDYFMLSSENAVLQNMLNAKAQQGVLGLADKGQSSRMQGTALDALMMPQSSEQTVRIAGVEQSNTSFSSYQEQTSSGRQGGDAQQFFKAPGSEDISEMSLGREVKHESSSESRVRQAQEAQSVASQMIKAAQFKQGANYSEFSVSLKPEYLGNMKVSITMEQDTLCARIATDSAYTRDILVQNVDVLKSSLETAGIQVEDIQISFDAADQGTQFQFAQGEGRETEKQAVRGNGQEFSLFTAHDVAEAVSVATSEVHQQSTETGIDVLI